MTANLLSLFSGDIFKLFIFISVFTIIGVITKNILERKKLEKKISSGEFNDNHDFLDSQIVNTQRTIDIHVDNLNPKFELIAKLETTNQADFPTAVIDKLEALIRVGHKSVRLSHRILGSLGSSKSFYVGMLLVNRHGSLTLVEHIEFAEILSLVSDEYDLKLTLNDYSNIVKKLKPLKLMISDLDSRLTLTIRFNQLPSKTAINGFAEKFNLKKYAEDRFLKIDKSGNLEFSIVPADYVYGINLVMDLPRVNDPEKVFLLMFDIADWLAFHFEGSLTDQKGNQLSNDSKSIIQNQVLSKIQSLKKFGLSPGENLSLRIFN